MLSEQIYALRRKNGLSQEQLAEQIGVSRQAISKWEGGLATPDLENLLALSRCFGITVDELTTGDLLPARPEAHIPTAHRALSLMQKLGIGLCLAGVLLLILAGAITLLSPPAAEQLNGSSAVTVNGSGLLFLFCIAVMAVGLFLILRRK